MTTTRSDVLCRNCGRRMRYAIALEPFVGSGSTLVPRKQFAKPGYNGNGKFCTQRCGYRWAVEHAPDAEQWRKP